MSCGKLNRKEIEKGEDKRTLAKISKTDFFFFFEKYIKRKRLEKKENKIKIEPKNL